MREPARDMIAEHQALLRRRLATLPQQAPERLSGRGIVTAIGGEHIAAGWVLLTLLREIHRCRLPIEVWYLNEDDFPPTVRALFQRFDVRLVDASRHQPEASSEFSGFELKAFALTHCGFAEALFIDADNVPLIDPAGLFDWPEYRRTGAIFWPDCEPVNPFNPIWSICGLSNVAGPEWESGQILIDKRRCWPALQLALHLNEQSSFYYQYVNGDKETFHLAWSMLGAPFAMPETESLPAWGVYDGSLPDEAPSRIGLWQHDFHGKLRFLHRTDAGWTAFGRIGRCSGFVLHDTCVAALAELRRLWDGDLSGAGLSTQPATRADNARAFVYRTSGSPERIVELLPGGRIGEGARLAECFWREDEESGQTSLVLSSRRGDTCRLTPQADGRWQGRWIAADQLRVSLTPLPTQRSTAAAEPTIKSLLYITPVVPADGGNGLAMRAANMLRLLFRTYAVSLLIIPLYPSGAEPDLPDWVERQCAAIRVVPPPAADDRESNLGDPGFITEWSAAAGRVYPRAHFDVIHLFRQSVYPFAEPYLYRGQLQAAEWWIDLDDVESRSQSRLAQLYQRRGLPAQHDQSLRQARVAALAEGEFLGSWDRVIVCSSDDRAYLTSQSPGGRAKISIIPNVIALPEVPPPLPGGSPMTIVFVGTFSYFPNTDAAIWFCRDVLPVIHEQAGSPFRVLLIGTGAGEEIIALGDIPEVEVVGPVADLTPWYSRADLVVVPLRAGGGTRIKLLEALAYRRPVVSTTIGAEGIEVVDGEHLLLADRAHHFAQQCLRVLSDQELAARLGSQGRRLVEERYGLEMLAAI